MYEGVICGATSMGVWNVNLTGPCFIAAAATFMRATLLAGASSPLILRTTHPTRMFCSSAAEPSVTLKTAFRSMAKPSFCPGSAQTGPRVVSGPTTTKRPEPLIVSGGYSGARCSPAHHYESCAPLLLARVTPSQFELGAPPNCASTMSGAERSRSASPSSSFAAAFFALTPGRRTQIACDCSRQESSRAHEAFTHQLLGRLLAS